MNTRRTYTQLAPALLAAVLWTSPGMADTLDDGLVAYWDFDECSGGTAHDSSGYDNHGTIYGADWVPGVSGCGLEIVDTDIVRFIPSSVDDPITTAFTIAGWVYWYGEHPETYCANSYILDARTHASAGFILYAYSDGRVRFRVLKPGDDQGITSVGTIPVGKWAHVAAVFDQTSQTLRLFINAREDDDSPATATAPYYDGYLMPAIGNNHWAPGDGQWAPLNGIVDELLVYNQALTAAEVWDLYQQYAQDCNSNGIPDSCDLDCGLPEGPCDIPGCGESDDCQPNGIPDECDIAAGTSQDADSNGIPDECEGVYLDIKPGSCPNPLNRGSHGVLPVALLGTTDFDATMIDVSSVRLGRADGVGGLVAPHEGPPGPHSAFEDVGTPFEGEPCDCHEAGADGFVDLSMKFETDDVVANLLLDDLDAGALVELVVTGELLDGAGFAASDCVRLVPPGVPPALLSVQSSVPGAWVDVSPPDEALDGGGSADFQRGFPLTTIVTLTAEEWAMGRPLRGWQIGGLLHHMGQTSVELAIDQDTTVTAVYGPTPSGGTKPPPSGESAPEPIQGQTVEVGTIGRR